MIYTNYFGNMVDCTYEEALNNGYNINCTNCTNCKYCIDCTDCTHCIDCIDCTNCKYCTHCTHCTHYTDCKDCINCTDCTHCTDCKDCTHCTDCKNCINCTYCKYCKDCTDCTKQPICIITDSWIICIRETTMKIGCQDHSISTWLSLTDEEITSMHEKALSFWTIWKPIITLLRKLP